jgi:hypothetical protein
MAIFLKTYGEDMLQCSYKDYSSLNRWQANRDLLSAIYFFVTTHQCQAKEVSILSLGDVNPGPVPLRWGCLIAVCHAIEIAVCRAMSHDRIPRVSSVCT